MATVYVNGPREELTDDDINRALSELSPDVRKDLINWKRTKTTLFFNFESVKHANAARKTLINKLADPIRRKAQRKTHSDGAKKLTVYLKIKKGRFDSVSKFAASLPDFHKASLAKNGKTVFINFKDIGSAESAKSSISDFLEKHGLGKIC